MKFFKVMKEFVPLYKTNAYKHFTKIKSLLKKIMRNKFHRNAQGHLVSAYGKENWQ